MNIYLRCIAARRRLLGLAERASGAGESEFGMIADQERAVVSSGGREISGDDCARSRLQSRRQMFLIFDKNQIVGRRRFDTGHGGDLGADIANQAGADGFGDLLRACASWLSLYSSRASGRKSGDNFIFTIFSATFAVKSL